MVKPNRRSTLQRLDDCAVYVVRLDMSLTLQTRSIPQVWRITILGVGASLPAAAVMNWLPNSESTIAGAVMIIGASVAGAIAAGRSTAPSAAGLRAGFLGGVIAVLTYVFTEALTATWSASRLAFFVFAGGVVLCISPVFGLVFGRVGGWVANTFAPQ